MPRKPRFLVTGIANHIIQRENNKAAVFFEDDLYLLACMRYIEMNPVRAHMVKAPARL